MISRARTAALAAVTLAAACTVQQTEIPALIGPSEFALSVSVTATPDTINQDGASQSSIVVAALGPNGDPMAGVAVRLDMAVSGVRADFGTLSARNLVTDSTGRATTIYTAPAPPPPGTGGPFNVVTILATPSGTNYQAAVEHTADIRLTTPGVILPPAGTPTARFSFSPAAPTMNTPVFFNASTSCASGGTCTSTAGIVSFAWTFGDGSQASRETVTHEFTVPGTYSVILTVTNDRGVSASTMLPVTVDAGTAPTADFVFSPAAPGIGTLVQFNASASSAAPGRTIEGYIWNWGDGDSGRGKLEDHDYSEAGTYTVTLTVVDDVGQEGTVAKTVTVGAGDVPTADFVFSPTAPVVSQTVHFNASTSSAAQGETIVSHAWNFGDGDTGSGRTPNHSYDLAGTYSVTLRVTDSAGNRGVTTKTITVGSGTPIANFTISPSPPVTAGTVLTFDGSSSQAFGGATIVEYSWSWGDLSANGGGVSSTHSFAAAGTYTVTLTVTDSAARTAQTSKSVVVQP